MIKMMDDGEHTFEVTGVGDNNGSGLFEKVERCGHDGLRERLWAGRTMLTTRDIRAQPR
jgi:hypothetical protein